MRTQTKKNIGDLGENLAVKYLINKNYLILAKKYYIRGGEIDITVQDSKTKEIVFVEVKTRSSNKYGYPEQAVNEQRRLRLNKAAQRYLIDNNYKFDQNYRFDVIAIELNMQTRMAKISHFERI